MPLIQRNLFPRRPPSKKCNGPSVLQLAQQTTDNIKIDNSKRSKVSKKLIQKSDSSVILNQELNIDDIPITNKTDTIVKYLDNSDLPNSDTSCAPSQSSTSSSSASEMISRRRILSRSRDALNCQDEYNPYEEEEDIWFNKDKLYKNHIQEVLLKWDQIDDEIWAKIICMERNRRVAKAYARAPILTINGCDNGFDGYRIGLNGFDNPMRDPKTEEIKRTIGLGVKVKMDQDGNVLIKRCSKTNVYVKGWSSDNDTQNSVSNDVIKANGLLEMQKSVKLFDMKKFQQNVYRELKNAYPDRRKLEDQCISIIAFVKDASDVLDVPVWVMIINIVAMDMLKSKLPPIDNKRPNNMYQMFERSKSFPEEDPYSMPSNSSGGKPERKISDKSRPPRLPPRDVLNKKPPINLPKPDYEVDTENEHSDEQQKTKSDINRKFEDPYYCGFSARVPNFVKRLTGSASQTTSSKGEPPIMKKASSKGFLSKSGRNGGHYELTHSESDSFLSKMNGTNSISSGYVSGSNTTNSIRSDNNDIYGIHRKYSSPSRYPFNLKPNQLSSVQMHQLFSGRSGPSSGLVVGEWE